VISDTSRLFIAFQTAPEVGIVLLSLLSGIAVVIAFPLSLIPFPVFPVNTAICPAVELAGPTTAPSIFVYKIIQFVVLPSAVLSSVQIKVSPTSTFYPFICPTEETRYVCPLLAAGIDEPPGIAPMNIIASLIASILSTYCFVVTSMSSVGLAPTVNLPANTSLPFQSNVRALERALSVVPLPIIST
jgi:hypothetical protein